ncbi:SDR family NAD(P)-dependent oxidoreductase [Pseudofrankia inefficax]|nr:SDR family oxidoreductase [Pseudofrankia inefficax]
MDTDVAIVTGGAGDLGRGVCRALTKAGATVVALDLDPSRADGVERALRCDVMDPAACAAAVEEVVRDFGGVSTLVNLAQGWNKMPLLEVSDAEMRLVFESGPMASLRMMQLCHPYMKARGGGAVINCASASGTQGGVRGEGVYAGAKEAIRGITKHASVEWGPDNIRVNVLCPVATSDPNRWPPTVIDRIPLGRLGDPETDVGGTVVFLAGPSGSFITGRTLFIDGGAGMYR